MTLKKKILLALSTLIVTSAAQASLVVQSIDMAVVSTSYDSRVLPATMPDEQAASMAYMNGFLPAFNNPDTLICDISLGALENVGSYQNCDGPRRDTGTRFTIAGSTSGPVELQFGLDWGRGGFSVLDMADQYFDIERYNTDIWWARNWNHQDVLSILIPEAGDFLFVGFGFEGCCGGASAARWRPVSGNSISPLNSGPGGWQSFAVTEISEPAGLALLGLGCVGLGAVRRRGTKVPPAM